MMKDPISMVIDIDKDGSFKTIENISKGTLSIRTSGAWICQTPYKSMLMKIKRLKSMQYPLKRKK